MSYWTDDLTSSRKINSAFKYKVHFVFNFQPQNQYLQHLEQQNLPFLCIFFSHSDSCFNAPFIPQPLKLSLLFIPFMPIYYTYNLPLSDSPKLHGWDRVWNATGRTWCRSWRRCWGKGCVAAFPRTLVSKFDPKLPVFLWTPSPLLPFQPPDLNPVRLGGSLALNVHKNTTDASTYT